MALNKRASRQPDSDLIGAMAGEYRLVRKIGAGGFGTVYEAEHPILKRKAAVKVLHVNPAVDSNAVRRFLEEARSASQIRHRHIVDIFSFGTLPNGQYFYVMDLLDGMALDRYIKRHGRLAPELALPLLRRVAQAIDALHAAGIIHRDVKPANIYLAWESSGEVVPKLLDFGLVKLLGNVSLHTASGVPIGTPYYMSPEQCRGEAVDARADVYSFGVICHELLTGRVPFERDSAAAVLLAHVLEPPPRMSDVCPELSPELDEAVLHMLHKDPKARPESASAAIRELALVAQGAGVTMADTLPWLPRPAPESDAEAAPEGAPGARDSASDRLPESGTRSRPDGALHSRLMRIALLLGAVGLGAGVVHWGAGRDGEADQVQTPAPRSSGPAPAGARAPAGPEPAAQQAASAIPERSAPSPEPMAGAAAPASGPSGTAPGAPAPERVALTLRGAPAGAAVMLGDDKLGETPGPIWVPKGERELKLRVTAPGYGPKTVRITPTGPLDVAIPRDKAARAPNKAALRELEDPF